MTYTSELKINSAKFIRQFIESISYYEAIKVNVIEDGTYTFSSSSNLDTYGYIYEEEFHPFNPSFNKLDDTDDGGCTNQFKIIKYFERMKTYILVITTYDPLAIGSFSIIACGPNKVTLKHMSE